MKPVHLVRPQSARFPRNIKVCTSVGVTEYLIHGPRESFSSYEATGFPSHVPTGLSRACQRRAPFNTGMNSAELSRVLSPRRLGSRTRQVAPLFRGSELSSALTFRSDGEAARFSETNRGG